MVAWVYWDDIALFPTLLIGLLITWVGYYFVLLRFLSLLVTPCTYTFIQYNSK